MFAERCEAPIAAGFTEEEADKATSTVILTYRHRTGRAKDVGWFACS
jgi:hypothetical protein